MHNAEAAKYLWYEYRQQLRAGGLVDQFVQLLPHLHSEFGNLHICDI